MENYQNKSLGQEKGKEGIEALIALRDAAEKGDWDSVDASIPAAVQHREVMAWAKGVIISPVDLSDHKEHSVPYLDLALSLWAASSMLLGEDVRRGIFDLMSEEKNEVICFRAACALAAHGDTEEAVMQILRESSKSKDPDIAEAAKKRLEILRQAGE